MGGSFGQFPRCLILGALKLIAAPNKFEKNWGCSKWPAADETILKHTETKEVWLQYTQQAPAISDMTLMRSTFSC